MFRPTNERFFHKSPEQIRKEKLDQKMQNVKADLQTGVVRYYMKPKSQDQLQTPVHNIEYNQNKQKPKLTLYRTLQQVQVEPEVKVDEIQEMKWRTLSRNCQNLLEISRMVLDKPSVYKFQPTETKIAKTPKMRFLSKRHSIELRIADIQSSPPSQQPSAVPVQNDYQDPFYVRFKKFYQKIGLHSKDKQRQSFNQDERQMIKVTDTKKKHRSLHLSSSHSLNVPLKPKNAQYLKELLKLSSNAYNFQINLKKDRSDNIEEANQKLFSIRSDFNKFREMLNESDSF